MPEQNGILPDENPRNNLPRNGAKTIVIRGEIDYCLNPFTRAAFLRPNFLPHYRIAARQLTLTARDVGGERD